MKNALIGISATFLLSVSFGVSAQDPAEPPAEKPKEAAASPCPRVQIQNPAGRSLREGQPVSLAANIAGGDPNVQPLIIWNVSAGVITNGQGTRRIDVDSTGAGNYREIVADLWVGGYAPECTNQASASVKVIGPPVKVDEFAVLDTEKENARLATVAGILTQSTDNLYIVAYAGRSSIRGFAYAELRRMKEKLTAVGIPVQRIGTIDGGFREEPAFEIWIAPQGSEAPKPTPTVDRREIIYPTPTRATRTTTRRP